MARRSKEDIRIEKETDAAIAKHTSGRQFNIFDLSKISNAGTTAGKKGDSIDDAVRIACDTYEVKKNA